MTSTPQSSDPFAFASSWGLGDDAYAFLLAELRERRATGIVEFGSGTSTLRLVRDLPDATVFSVESDPRFHEQLTAQLAIHDPGHRVQLRSRQLRWQLHAGSPYLSYAAASFPDTVDAVIVDGPPQWTRRGREACLYQVFSALRVGGRVYLDDCVRKEEQRILSNWQRACSGSLELLRVEPVGHHVAVLEKTSSEGPRWTVPVFLDAVQAAARIGASAVRRRARLARADHEQTDRSEGRPQ